MGKELREFRFHVPFGLGRVFTQFHKFTHLSTPTGRRLSLKIIGLF